MSPLFSNDEIPLYICSFLDPISLVHFSETCKTHWRLAQDETLWKLFCEKISPLTKQVETWKETYITSCSPFLPWLSSQKITKTKLSPLMFLNHFAQVQCLQPTDGIVKIVGNINIQSLGGIQLFHQSIKCAYPLQTHMDRVYNPLAITQIQEIRVRQNLLIAKVQRVYLIEQKAVLKSVYDIWHIQDHYKGSIDAENCLDMTCYKDWLFVSKLAPVSLSEEDVEVAVKWKGLDGYQLDPLLSYQASFCTGDHDYMKLKSNSKCIVGLERDNPLIGMWEIHSNEIWHDWVEVDGVRDPIDIKLTEDLIIILESNTYSKSKKTPSIVVINIQDFKKLKEENTRDYSITPWKEKDIDFKISDVHEDKIDVYENKVFALDKNQRLVHIWDVFKNIVLTININTLSSALPNNYAFTIHQGHFYFYPEDANSSSCKANQPMVKIEFTQQIASAQFKRKARESLFLSQKRPAI